MAEQQKDHDTQQPNTSVNTRIKQNCPPEKETGILLLEERMADLKEESDEFESLREEWAELDKGSEAALSQESSPSQQANFKKQYNTLKEHSTVLIDKLQAQVEKKKKQISQLDQLRQVTERENRDLQRRIDMKENEMKEMQIELNKKEDQLSAMGEQIKALKHVQETLRRQNDLLVKESRKWLNLCEKIKQGNPLGEDTEIDKQIELLTSATPLIKSEIAVANLGKDSIAKHPGQTSDGTPGVEASCNVKITLVKGDIVPQKADVKVVSTTSGLDLSKGAVRALLDAGGEELEDDCKKQYRNRCDNLTVVNGGHTIQCHEIYLAHLRFWNKRDISDIPKAMETSLKLANAHGYKTILFSAIGTGPLNYPKDKVAIEMYQSVIDFAEEHAVTLKDIRFVTFDPDTTTAFEAEESFRKKPVNPVYVCDIGHIKFRIVIGEILEQRANAIICEVDSNFRGRVAHTLKQHSPEVAGTVRSRQRELEREGFTVMKNSGLPTRRLICVTFKGVPLRKRRILACLKKAHEEGCRSVSCYFHGEEQTSSTDFDTDEITSTLYSAVEEFSQKYQDSNIKCINYVLPECDEDKLTAVVELLQCMILRAEMRKRREKGQIVGFLLSKDVP